MDSPFKYNDTIYHYRYGIGRVTETPTNNIVRCLFKNHTNHIDFVNDNNIINSINTLSFTPYDLVNGGFTQVRPFNVGEIVYVINDKNYAGIRSFDIVEIAQVYQITNQGFRCIPIFKDKPSHSYLESVASKHTVIYRTLEDVLKVVKFKNDQDGPKQK